MFFKAFRLIIFFLTLVIYASVLISPASVWPAGFIAMLIPFALIFHFFMFLWYAFKKKKRAFFYLFLLLLGWPFIRATFSWNATPEDSGNSIKVLSYNVRVFNNYEEFDNENKQSSEEMINWAVSNNADVKCFQEFYESNEKSLFHAKELLKSKGWPYQHEKVRFTDKSGATFSMNIFSRLPIIKKGGIYSEDGVFQNGIYADILMNKDTIRIYNLHLQSMSIDENNIVDSDKLKDSYISTGWRMRRGFERRGIQTDYILKHIEKSPYPVILCGDLNEVPYSYTYFILRRHLKNAFETAGKGFGFSFSGKLFFLRIDNQFFSDPVKAIYYNVCREMSESDHYPIEVVYTVGK